MKPVKIREALPGDFYGVMRLLGELHTQDAGEVGTERQVFLGILEAAHFQLLVADNGQALLGTCYLNIIPNLTRGGRPYAVIENVVTGERYRRNGVGRLLIHHALSTAWEAGCYKAMLMSGRSSEAVKVFYEGCGFSSQEKQAYIARCPG